MPAGDLGAYESVDDIAAALAEGRITEAQAQEAIGLSGFDRQTNIGDIRARASRLTPSRPTASAGGEFAAHVPEQARRADLLRNLLTGQTTGAAGSRALHQLGLAPSGQGFGMDALNEVISTNRPSFLEGGVLEGAPPGPSPETAGQAVDALVQGTAPRDRQADFMRAILGATTGRRRLPSELESLLR